MSEECSDNELGSLFAAFDKDADGRIFIAELRLCMRETLGEDGSAEALMASVDADGDGLLDATEFARLVQAEDDSIDARLTTNDSAQAPPSLRNCFYTSFAVPARAPSVAVLGTRALNCSSTSDQSCRFPVMLMSEPPVVTQSMSPSSL
jgi:hypothetical protein